MNAIKINNRLVGPGYPAYIIAEMSANHAGSIDRAKEIIRKAKACGADCVKIQTYTPDTITIDCDNSYFQIEDGTWKGENLYHLYGEAFTPWEWQQELKEEADRIGIDFFSTPFDHTAVDFLEKIGVSFYKVASFELVDIPLISYIASKGKPIIMSTGMSTEEEIREALEAIYATGNDQVILLKCSSAYPAVSSDMHLKTIVDMGERFNVPIGLSDHSMGSLGATTAVTLGACVVEKHFCLSREIENPDASFSMTPDEFTDMVNDIKAAQAAIGDIAYGVSQQETGNVKFRRSLFVVKDVKAGEIFSGENVRSIRPGYGILPKYYDDVIGLKAACDIERGTPLSEQLIKDFFYVRTAKEEDEALLLEWKNDPVSLANSLQQQLVSIEDHHNWYHRKLQDKECRIYIAYVNETPVGMLRLDITDEVAMISYSVASGYRQKGFGQKILEFAIKKAQGIRNLNQLQGEVLVTNEASRKCFEKLNFRGKSKNENSILFEIDLREK